MQWYDTDTLSKDFDNENDKSLSRATTYYNKVVWNIFELNTDDHKMQGLIEIQNLDLS